MSTFAYDQFRAECGRSAVLFERAAEKARTTGTAEGMALAHILSEHAIKLRYLAEYDPDVAQPYELEARS